MDERVTGDLEQDVANEEDHQADRSASSMLEAQVYIHARDARNSDIRSIYESDGVETSEDRQ